MVSVRVEIGPVSRESAEAWFEYADAVIHDLRKVGADRAPPEVLDTFEELLDTWRSELPGDPADGEVPEPFYWASERADDEVGYLINALYETGLAVEAVHDFGGMKLRPSEADEFHYAVVNQVLAALEAEGGPQSHLVEILREHWDVAGD
jgi:hypothetical protein